MPSLQELKDQIAELQLQATELHQRESADAIATVKELVSRYGLTAEQVGLGASRQPRRTAKQSAPVKASRAGAGVPKYVDPSSGKTWTGFGKPPAWIAGADDRSAFLIAKPAAARPAAPVKRVAKKARTGK